MPWGYCVKKGYKLVSRVNENGLKIWEEVPLLTERPPKRYHPPPTTSEELNARKTPSEEWAKYYIMRCGIPRRKWKQNKAFGPFFLDFYFKNVYVALEIDGGYHDTPEQQEKDRTRTELLLRMQPLMKVMRVKHGDVKGLLDTLYVIYGMIMGRRGTSGWKGASLENDSSV